MKKGYGMFTHAAFIGTGAAKERRRSGP